MAPALGFEARGGWLIGAVAPSWGYGGGEEEVLEELIPIEELLDAYRPDAGRAFGSRSPVILALSSLQELPPLLGVPAFVSDPARAPEVLSVSSLEASPEPTFRVVGVAEIHSPRIISAQRQEVSEEGQRPPASAALKRAPRIVSAKKQS